MIERVQELALSICGLVSDPLFARHVEIFERVATAGGTQSLHAPLIERPVRKSIYAAIEDLESAEAEWLVLDALLRRGWTLKPFARTTGSPDWRVSQDGKTIDVDAKQKASRSAAFMRLTSALRGAALSVQGAFLNEFRWEWDVPETCRSKVATRFMRAFWTAMPETATFLRQQCSDKMTLWAEGHWSLVAERDGSRTTVSLGESIEGSRYPKPAVSLSCEPTRFPQYFSSGSSDAAFLEEFGPDTYETLGKVLGKLGIEKQATQRGTPTLFVVVWHVPFTWEPSLSNDGLQRALDALSRERNWPAVLLWPLGVFEAAKTGWKLNDKAKRMIL
jgi:hypothetical protein